MFIHSYAPNANTYFPDRTYLVKVLGTGESWSSSTIGVTVSHCGVWTNCFCRIQHVHSRNNPTFVLDCPSYACSEPIQTSTSKPNSNPEFESQTSSKDTISSGAIIGISVGSAVFLAVIAFVFNTFMKHRRQGYGRLSPPASQNPVYDQQPTASNKSNSYGNLK